MANTRYRVVDEAANILEPSNDELVYLFTVILALLIGFVLVWLGLKGRQIWLVSWSGGLIVAATAYLVWAFAH